MARLPIPGSDAGNWGQILNDYLSAAHKADGTLKPNSVSTTSIIDGAVTEAKLASAVQTKLNNAGGSQGATGPQGPAGTPGTPGATGAAGAAGQTGATGAQGTAGTAGTPGAAGATGPQGATGPAGTGVSILGSVANQGSLPPSGNNLGDAYLISGHLWVWTGSEWEDAGNIQGPAGNTGATGAAGTAGQPGATGAQGTAGTAGNTGATGPAGTGATGPQGPAGTPGATGAQGLQGATGPAGGGGGAYNFRSISTSTTAVAGDFIFITSVPSAITITLPSPSANGLVRVKRLAAAGNGVQVAAPGGSVIDGAGVGTHTLNSQYQSNDFLSDGTNWYRV